jgi:mono/diheme cytochrome c family protein
MKNLVYVLSFGVILLSACGSSIATSDTNADATLAPVPAEYAGLTNPLGPEDAAQGGQIFRTNCEMCHGPEGHGDGPAGQSLDPRPRNLAEIQAQAGDDFLYWRIHDGKPGTAMVAWKGILTEEQIWQVVSFIRTLK